MLIETYVLFGWNYGSKFDFKKMKTPKSSRKYSKCFLTIKIMDIVEFDWYMFYKKLRKSID
jgi:hypothetical protein